MEMSLTKRVTSTRFEELLLCLYQPHMTFRPKRHVLWWPVLLRIRGYILDCGWTHLIKGKLMSSTLTWFSCCSLPYLTTPGKRGLGLFRERGGGCRQTHTQNEVETEKNTDRREKGKWEGKRRRRERKERGGGGRWRLGASGQHEPRWGGSVSRGWGVGSETSRRKPTGSLLWPASVHCEQTPTACVDSSRDLCHQSPEGCPGLQLVRLAGCTISQPYSGGLILPPSSCVSSSSQTGIRAGWALAGGFSFFAVTSATCS